VCTSFYESIQKASLRWQAVGCLPTGATRTHELRRRLAAVFLFDDLRRGRQNPEASFSIRAVIDRLDADEFMIFKGIDYQDLTALVKFLDIFIDDAGRRQQESSGAEQQFNSDIDELAGRLKVVFLRIDASPSASAKLECKTLLEAIQYRLLLSVRTRRQPKQSLYDRDQPKEDGTRQRQQQYMQLFLRKAKRPVTPETT
jgi:hypothetical protein